ncbi:DUF7123 family protein [Halococcus qingdaonensis]|uniref:DUF7123 family protein n=1 Tax=Halococcus qingdaonensis TaxID=224402 RepID=UPI0021166F7A|nr:hypothetical protein [Halococcus qingdaonensis]
MAARSAPMQTLSEKQRRILSYLREHADSKTYFKSRLIGDALGLSPKEVGTNMNAIRKTDNGLSVEKWGYSSSTTWKVTQ